MEHKKAVCNKDCFNCPYPDCVNGTLDMEDYAEAAALDAALMASERGTTYKSVKKSPEQAAKASARRKKYYEEHRERSAATHHEWYMQNKEKVLATHTQYRKANIEKVRETAKVAEHRRRDSNPELYKLQKRVQARAYYHKNLDKMREKARIRYRIRTGKTAYWQYALHSTYGDGFVCSVCGCWMFANAHKPNVCPDCGRAIVAPPPEQGRLRSVEELTMPELDELRELYSMLRKDEFGAISDATLFKQYGKTLFQDGDFLCNMQEV